jgi:hypothetical protein
MSNTVIAIKKSSTPGATPDSGAIVHGELALNYADGKLFYKAANGTVYVLNSSVDNFGVVNVNGTLIVADGPSDVLTIAPEDATITLTANVTTDRITIAANLKPVFDATNAAFAQANSGGPGGASVLVSDTSPPGATANTLWWNSNTGKLSILYQDSNSAQWVDTSGRGTVSYSNVSFHITEVDFGSTPVYEKQFGISHATATNSSVVMAIQSLAAATGKSQDENEADSLVLSAYANNGYVIIYARAIPGPVVGKYKINYYLG